MPSTPRTGRASPHCWRRTSGRSYHHTGEEFDGEQFVALNRDYPGRWRFVREVVVDAGSTAVLRARVSDAAGASPETHYVASFGTVDDAGRLIVLEELWAEVDRSSAGRAPTGHGCRRARLASWT